MRIIQCQRSLFLVVCVVFGIAPSALEFGESSANSLEPLTRAAEGEPITRAVHQQVIRDIPSLGEVEQPLTSAEGLLVQQPAPNLAQVTGVQLKPTENGLEVILETTAEFAEVLNSETDNSLITDIPNAQLRLPKGGAFRQDDPTQDIASVEVINLDAKTLRVTVTGKAGVPTAEVSQSPQALILSVVAPPAPQPTPVPTVPPPVTPAPPAEPQQPAPPEPPAPAPPAESQQPAAPEPPAPEPQAEEAPVELTVRAEEEAGNYNVPDATTATKTDTPIRDIPASIQVVPRQVLEDQRAVRLQDAVQNVSGVTQAGNYGGTGSGGYIIRGFEQYGNFRNGFRDSNFFTLLDIANVERVEVLKGPASSVLFGQVEPGGIINIVTKQPLSEPYYAAEFTAGSYNFYRPTLDISGPLNTDKTLLYRLNVAYENSGSFRDFVDTERIFIAPSLTWEIGPSTTLNVDFEYLNNDTVFDRGIPAIGNRPAPIPISRYLGTPEADDS